MADLRSTQKLFKLQVATKTITRLDKELKYRKGELDEIRSQKSAAASENSGPSTRRAIEDRLTEAEQTLKITEKALMKSLEQGRTTVQTFLPAKVVEIETNYETTGWLDSANEEEKAAAAVFAAVAAARSTHNLHCSRQTSNDKQPLGGHETFAINEAAKAEDV